MSQPVYARAPTPDERQALEASLQNPQQVVRRRCQILLSSAAGANASQIAAEVGCTRQTVRNAIAAWHKRGLGCLQPYGVRQPKRCTRRRCSQPVRAIQRDRSKRPLQAPPDQEIEQLLQELVTPAAYSQAAAFRQMGMRSRILTLPLMVAFVVSLLWRQLGSVADAVRALNREGLLWVPATRVSLAAAAKRLQTFPAALFQGVLVQILPVLQARWAARSRPCNPALTWARRHFEGVWALDGSTLDGLLRKVGLLREEPCSVLAGRVMALLDVCSRLPLHLWYEEDSHAHDLSMVDRVMEKLRKGVLLLIDMGFTDYGLYDRLCQQGVWFVTRLKSNAHFTIVEVLHKSDKVLDVLIRLGTDKDACQHLLRMVDVQVDGAHQRYLSSVRDPKVLPVEYLVSLYWHRWCIEEAFLVVKRLLGLAFFHTGSIEGVKTQLWSTWLLYAVLVDLTDAVAERLAVPYDAVSLEMVFRSLYHYTQARQRGETDDVVSYLARPDNRDLGVLKRKAPQRAYSLPFRLGADAA
jgi:transposase